jgi:hypothetical protein
LTNCDEYGHSESDIDDILGIDTGCSPSRSKKSKSVVASDEGDDRDSNAVAIPQAANLNHALPVQRKFPQPDPETSLNCSNHRDNEANEPTNEAGCDVESPVEYAPRPGERCFALETLPGKQAVMYFVKVREPRCRSACNYNLRL